MSEPSWSPEVIAWLRAGLDPDFRVRGQASLHAPWQVVDAEGRVLASCESVEMAALVRNALDAYHEKMAAQRGLEVEAWIENG